MDANSETREIMNSNKRRNIIMSRKRIKKNLFVLSFGSMLLFSAYMALANLQSTMNNAGNIGVISQSTIYASMIVGCLLLPKLIIKKIGCKWTATLSALLYAPYMVANLYPAVSTLLPTAIILGVGSATMWTSLNTYINQLAYRDAGGDDQKAVLSSSKFFGIFQMIFPTTQIWGNLLSFYVFRPDANTDGTQSSLDSFVNDNVSLSCGVEFCGGSIGTQLNVSMKQRYSLIGIDCCLSVASAVMFGLFLDSLKSENQEENSKDGTLRTLAASFRQMVNIDQLLMAFLTINCGLQQGFLFSDYSEAYVACALGLDSVGLVFACYGVVCSVTSLSAGYAIKYVPRAVIMTTGALNIASVLLALLLWTPSQNSLDYFLFIGFWGFSDAIFQTQLSAIYGTLFRSNEEAAFANNEIFRSIGFFTAFACSSVLCTASKIYMLYGCVSLGIAGYYVVELRRKTYTDTPA